MPPSPARRNTKLAPALASFALVGTVLVAGAASDAIGGGDDADRGSSSSGPTAGIVAATTSTVAVTTTTLVTTTSTTAPPVKTNLSETMGAGSFGDEVTAVQQRLKDLGFDPGPIDGDFGSLTRASVWAFEKLVMQTPRSAATGRVTNEMWQLMQEPLQFMPRRPDAASVNHTEIYLPEQVVIFFREDRAALISHMSSGTGDEWCQEVTISPGEVGNETGVEPLKRGECGVSKTPGGVFTFDRLRTGARESALGTLWNPMYFNFGIAIHGALNVPLEPASHGCIRIPMTLAEYFQTIAAVGDQVFVFDGVEEPEAYDENEKSMIFNRLDPNYSTTTTSTIAPTTVPLPPAETAPPETAPVTPAATVPATAAPTQAPAVQEPAPAVQEPAAAVQEPAAGGGANGSGGGGQGAGGGGGQPAPTQPAPTQPAPTQPAPTQPAPTRPAPTQPASTRPAPTQPPPPPPTQATAAPTTAPPATTVAATAGSGVTSST
ncbi:MAG: peptidoglycan-binding protein [Ilumatobacteraceae bacterium]